MKRGVIGLLLVLSSLLTMSACSPDVGSVAWCNAMDEKSKMDWTARELRDYAEHCLDK